MPARQSSLNRYYPYVLAGGVLLLSLTLYRLYSSGHPEKRLKRSNARRLPRRHRSHASTAPDPGGVITNEQLHHALNGEGNERIDIPESVAEALVETGHAAQEARGAGHAETRRTGGSDSDTEFSFTAETKENMENQNLLTLLYTIAQDQAQREAYVHRGVTCNNCNIVPIRGVRYRCANCLDYDLCEQCEAIDAAHPRTHLFYKVRIPAPFLGNPRHAQAPWYPGKPQMMPMSITPDILKYLGDITKFDQPEIEALYEQFKCLAATEYDDKRFGINAAISRQTFDNCFIPSPHLQPPPPNLIYDRVFAFYDTNSDGLIDFEEFVVGLAATPSNNKSKVPERLKRIFRGYDLDDNGYVDRTDFLRMFRAFYALSKDLVKDIVASMGDELYDPAHMDSVLLGRQPVSAAFTSSIPPSSRPFTKPPPADPKDETEDPDTPAVLPSSRDVVELKHGELPDGNEQREADAPASPRGSGPEKARSDDFYVHRDDEDDLDLPDDERDVGNEILYQMTLQGINELLDILFKAKERECHSPTLTAEDATANAGVDAETSVNANRQIEGSAGASRDGAGQSHPLPAALHDQQNSGNTAQDNTHGQSHTDGGIAPLFAASSPSALVAATEKVHAHRKTREEAKREAKERGGEGRLNYKEFEQIMTGKDAGRLRFVSTWIEIASF